MSTVKATSNNKKTPAVSGTNTAGGIGVSGTSSEWQGVHGESTDQVGVYGVSQNFIGVWGESKSTGQSGVYGLSQKWHGVHGESTDQAGVVGVSQNFVGVWGESKNAGQAGIYGKGTLAARFDGDVEVTGDIRLLNADVAEDFSVSDVDVEDGTVMIFNSEGLLTECIAAYDKKVAGVISGAGNYKPGMILDNANKDKNRKPVALIGKVYCKADADFNAIEIGDLLTTSSTKGHAMKAMDPLRAFGTVIGKALKPLASGKGLIPVLISLQ